jgi:ADP-ribose pyrophosphatase
MQPEQMISSERVFDGRIVRVRADAVLLPNGRNTTREVVEHRPSVVVVPIDADGNAILVRQHRYPAEQVLLEAPAGVVEESETPDDCAMRELQEEIGFSSRDLRALGGFWMSPGYCTEFMYAYLAKDLVPSRLQADADESIEVERVSISGVSRLIRLGEIQDAKTIAALLMAVYLFDAGG